jgi:hypothetical protein
MDHICELAFLFKAGVEQWGVKGVIKELVQIYFWILFSFTVKGFG